LAILGYVGGEDVVKTAVFADDYDDVLDWRARVPRVTGFLRVGQGPTERELEERKAGESHAQSIQASFRKFFKLHSTTSPFLCVIFENWLTGRQRVYRRSLQNDVSYVNAAKKRSEHRRNSFDFASNVNAEITL
jgi:hypothetical protein